MKPEESQQNPKLIERLFLKELTTNEIKNEWDETIGWEEKIKRNDLKYETNKPIHDFQQFKTIRSFDKNIISAKVIVSEADEDRSILLKNIVEFNDKSRRRTKEGKMEKRNTFDSVNALYEGQEITLNAFKSGIFLLKHHKEQDWK